MSDHSNYPFEVVDMASGRTYQIPPDKSILQVLLDAGRKPWYGCQLGRCGACIVGVVQGEVEHRDSYLTNEEKAAGDQMMICVSRAKSASLVLKF